MGEGVLAAFGLLKVNAKDNVRLVVRGRLIDMWVGPEGPSRYHSMTETSGTEVGMIRLGWRIVQWRA